MKCWLTTSPAVFFLVLIAFVAISNILPFIAALIADGLKKEARSTQVIDVLACENMMRHLPFLYEEVQKFSQETN